MTPTEFRHAILRPGLAFVETVLGIRATPAAETFLLAIALQETALLHRYQVTDRSAPWRAGPAHGWWQFEKGGGVKGVLSHPLTHASAETLCRHCNIPAEAGTVWHALMGHDYLAVGFARLLVRSDPAPLPTTGVDAEAYYLRTWRPGKPDAGRWVRSWALATSESA